MQLGSNNIIKTSSSSLFIFAKILTKQKNKYILILEDVGGDYTKWNEKLINSY